MESRLLERFGFQVEFQSVPFVPSVAKTSLKLALGVKILSRMARVIATPDIIEQSVKPEAPEVEARRRRGLFFIRCAAAGVGMALSLQLGLNSNFVADEMHLSGLQQGILETYRESCGIFALGLLALMAAWAEPYIGAVMLVLLGAGLSGYCFVPDFTWLVIASLVWSQGFHVWVPLPGSMTLALAEPGRAGYRLGQVQSAGAIGSATGLAIALALVGLGLGTTRPLYLLGGGAALLGGLACLGIPCEKKVLRPRLIFRRRYSLYYLLTFLEGWRKQVCIAFAGYLLVKQYHASLAVMLSLWLAAQLLGWFLAPRIGRWIDLVGERRALVTYYTAMAILFSGYGFIEHRGLLYSLFVLDTVLFAFTMAQTTYVNRIAPPNEHTATLSMGVAMNHVAAVTMPLTGGLLWNYAGYRWAFLTGVVAALLSILASLFLPAHTVASQIRPTRSTAA
jgi:MFS family permease